jgi:serine/threonine protein kinase
MTRRSAPFTGGGTTSGDRPMSDCLSDAELNRLRAHDMSDGSQDRARRHLEACGDCRSRDQKIAARHEKLLEAGRQHFASGLETFTAIDPSEDGRHPVPDLRIEGYQLLRELGRGGQGVVYQALQLATRSKVAIKVLLHGSYASESARRRFEREIAMVAQLRHPGIISVHDSGVTPDGRLYYVMEYLRGLPLTEATA